MLPQKAQTIGGKPRFGAWCQYFWWNSCTARNYRAFWWPRTPFLAQVLHL